jgi:two-component system sensor histidine kinase/response regulator
MKHTPLKILIVDDVPENLVALEALLRREGLEILKARSGSEALELLLVHEVALALLDVQMPELDGLELAELMRGAERTKHVPIVFVTAGSHDPARVFKGYETGAVDFLFKPIDPFMLRSKVDVFLQLARQRRELAHALQLNETFVGILGHDLRSPLSAIVAGTEILKYDLTDERHQLVLQRMTSSTRRMREMIDQLLDLTRARLGGGVAISRVPVDARELVLRSIEELRIAHSDREIRFEGPECSAAGDPVRLLQLFSNLLGNAIVHGAPGTPVTARLTCKDAAVELQIHNEGAIPPALLATLFEPFRARSGTTGLGLGLFIAQEIARAHGGTIFVESSEAAGTTFTVRLPGHQPIRAVG